MILDADWNQKVVIVHFFDILPSHYHWLLMCRFLKMDPENYACKWLIEVEESQIWTKHQV